MVKLKTTGEQTTKGLWQATHDEDVNKAMSDIKLHNQIKRMLAFILS